MWPRKPRPQRNDLQGNVLTAYRTLPHVAHTFVEIKDRAGGRQLLRTLYPLVTTEEAGGRERADPTLNVAITIEGLAALGVPSAVVSSFPRAFRDGMAARAKQLGDVGESAPDGWDAAFKDGTLHLLITQCGATRIALDDQIRELCRRIEQIDAVQAVALQRCQRDAASHERFGFRDGIAQPAIRAAGLKHHRGDGTPGCFGRWHSIALGEFVFGYRDADGVLPTAPSGRLGRNGTYVVYRKLRQDTEGFDALVASGGTQLGDPELFAAKLVGRWKGGWPLARLPTTRPPGSAGSENKDRLNDFRYDDDPVGKRCPVGAHIRRANPRDGTGAGRNMARRHRIIRRGTPYHDESGEAGLIFVCFNVDIERQFEFIQRMWLNDGDVLGLGSDPDPIAGNWDPATRRQRRFVIPGDRPLAVGLQRPLVTTRGGAYLLLPSMDALRGLGDWTI